MKLSILKYVFGKSGAKADNYACRGNVMSLASDSRLRGPTLAY
jgi:hypothetical protein